MEDESIPSETVTRKPDDDVGKPGLRPAAGGHQSPLQAELTRPGPAGRSDRERARSPDWAGGQEGHGPPPIGGSSGGHSDQKSADSSEGGGRVAQGHYKVEQEKP